MYSLPRSYSSTFHNSEHHNVQKQGREKSNTTQQTLNPYSLNDTENKLVKSAIPTPSEFMISSALGALAALLLAPLWMRHPLPNGTKSLESLGTVVKDLEHSEKPTDAQSNHQNELVAFLADPAVLMMMIPVLAPHLTRPALGATAVLGISYLASNVLSGFQEVWVRWQESQIRANLVGNLSTAYQASIEAKTQIDEDNHLYAEDQIRRILKGAGIPNEDAYLSPLPFECMPSSSNPNKVRERDDFRHKQSNFAILPQNRSPMPRAAHFIQAQQKQGASNPSSQTSEDPSVKHIDQANSPLDFKKASRWTLNGVGAGLGLTMASIGLYAIKAIRESVAKVVQPLSQALEQDPQKVRSPLNEKQVFIKNTLAPQNTEAVLLHFFQSKQGFIMAGLFIAMGVMLRTMQFLVEGLREIEVTRLNAETEKQYETYKLTTLEPHFKAISERSQLEHALRNLKKNVQEKKLAPEELHQQIQRILDNIGYNWSAPNYYPMSPATQLVTARS
ncbi:MAG: hypothetical protein LW809_03240 [Vampirovibrionales bacterium]|jgi:hypothetical protein|nr:hypothetical protein [Vampirovibrionales bacterium]